MRSASRARSQRPARSRRRPALTAALAAAVLLGLGACGGEPVEEVGVGGLSTGPQRPGALAGKAQCRDWVDASAKERFDAIVEIRQQLTSSGIEQDTRMSDEEAYEIVDNACSNGYAQSFRLYKVYARAAAFSNFAP